MDGSLDIKGIQKILVLVQESGNNNRSGMVLLNEGVDTKGDGLLLLSLCSVIIVWGLV